MPTQRLDKWLWFARVVKSRTRAAKLITAGKVRVNKQRQSKPAVLVAPGDVITAVINHRVRILKIVAPGTRRGPACEARTLYEDLSPPPAGAKSDTPQTSPPVARRQPGSGRPTKRQRRAIDALRGR